MPQVLKSLRAIKRPITDRDSLKKELIETYKFSPIFASWMTTNLKYKNFARWFLIATKHALGTPMVKTWIGSSIWIILKKCSSPISKSACGIIWAIRRAIWRPNTCARRILAAGKKRYVNAGSKIFLLAMTIIYLSLHWKSFSKFNLFSVPGRRTFWRNLTKFLKSVMSVPNCIPSRMQGIGCTSIILTG